MPTGAMKRKADELACAKFDFTGKRAVITGAGKGIGRNIVEALHATGATICALSRTAADLESLQAALGKDRLKIISCDLVDMKEVEKAMTKALDLLEGIDYLVNNAGIAQLAPILETTAEDWDTTMKVNAQAALVCLQVAARRMIADGIKGAIVNVSSQASVVATPQHTAYCASKAAMDMLTKMACLELGAHGIRCNSVNPTVVMTSMGKKGMEWREGSAYVGPNSNESLRRGA